MLPLSFFSESKHYFFRFAWLILIMPFSLSAYFSDPSVLIDASYLFGNGIGYNQGYASLRSLFNAYNPNGYPLTPFLDARIHYTDNNHWAANIGLGGRFLLSDSILGINAFYDFRGTSLRNYNRVGLGAEWLVNGFCCRLNGYFPTGSTRSKPFDIHHGKYRREEALNGMDAELSTSFRGFQKSKLIVGLGPYFYQGKKNHKAYGGQARIQSYWGRYFSIEGAGSYDSLFKARGHVSIALTFPLGPPQGSCSDINGMFEPVNRAEIIAIDRHKKTF